MATPKGTRCVSLRIAAGESIHVYSSPSEIVLQLRKEVPTEQDVCAASFKVGLKLRPSEALKLAGELLSAAGLMVTDK